MKKFLSFTLLPLTLLLSFDAFGQEIDPSLLKNLSPAQIEMAKSQLAQSKSIEKPKPDVKESTKRVSSGSDINKSINKKYGYNYFASTPTTITAVGDLPLPNDYKISLYDQFTIILSGSKEAIFDLNVNLDGSILFPELGSISVRFTTRFMIS